MKWPTDYICLNCQKVPSEAHDSMVCLCGGDIRPDKTIHSSRPFEAGWCSTLKCEVTSWKDQEKKAREHRSHSHPQGFVMAHDSKEMKEEMKKWANIRRHREDYMKATIPGYAFGESKKPHDHNRPGLNRIGKRTYSYAR